MSNNNALFCIDMGTTRTRVWLTQGDRITHAAAADFGARDTATSGQPWLRAQLIALMEEAARSAPPGTQRPATAIAAGMITSQQGLREVPHIAAPADAAQIASGMLRFDLDGTVLWLVPGVRTGDAASSHADIMRGEETLCVGLAASGFIKSGTWLLTLGSHWKWIYTDSAHRIVRAALQWPVR